MAIHLLRKIASGLVTLLGASLIVFVALRILPGDAASVLLGPEATPASLAALRERLGLNAPLPVQYFEWLGGILRGDLGTSIISGNELSDELKTRLRVTLPLTVGAMVGSQLIAIPLGALAALRHRKPTDAVVSGFAQLGVAVPAFWLGIMFITFFSVRLHILPAGGFTPWSTSPAESFRSLIMPVVVLAVVYGAVYTRYVRASVLEVLREDHIRTALAWGHSRRGALIRHGLRNASIPIVTLLALSMVGLLGGAIVVENVFTLPGIGMLLLQSLGRRDYTFVQSLSFLVAAAVVATNVLMDIVYAWLDPRVRTGVKTS
jgi:peptide/nickel transport system permease protein